jgi:type I restriction enzyme, S subunit
MSLPESWVETTIGKVVLDLQPGFAQKPGEDDEGMTPQIRTHNISPEGKITLAGIKYVSASSKELERYRLAVDDVVFNNTNSEEWVGKTAVFDQEGEYVFSNHMTRLCTDASLINSDFLASYLQLLWSMGYSKTRAKRWVSQAGIEGATLASFKLPLPTLPEQKRIVDVLGQAEAIGNLRNHAQAIVNQLAKQRFAEMFGHPAENSKGFESLLFQEFGTLDRGVSKHRPRDAEHLMGGPYPFIQTGDVANAGDWITAYKSTYSEAGFAQSKLWPKGTLCITIAANIAKAAILEFDACFPDSVVGFTPHEGICSEYVLYCLRFYQEFFEHRAPKAAQMNINLDTLRTLRMPKPPEALQKEFSEFVRAVRSLNQMTTTQVEGQSNLVNELRIAAFSGDLTANWRLDNKAELATAAKERDEILRERGTKISAQVAEPTPPVPVAAQDNRPARRWLIDELSEFQRRVLSAFVAYSEQPLLAEDPDVFAAFCADDLLTEQLATFSHSPNRIRRTLGQLAALGLIAKITLPKINPITLERAYLKAFRPLRDDENTRLTDVAALRRALSAGKPQEVFHFEVTLDYATSERAGTSGMFQVVALTDDEQNDRCSLVDQGTPYPSLQALANAIATTMGVSAEQIELNEIDEASE